MTLTISSKRSLLLALSIIVLAVAAGWLVLSRGKTEPAALESSASAPSKNGEPHATALEATPESGSVRAEAPKPREGVASAPVAPRILVVSGTVRDVQSRAPVASVEFDAEAGPAALTHDARAKTTSSAEGHYALELAIPADLAWDVKVWAVEVNAIGERFAPAFFMLHPADFVPDPTKAGTFVAAHDIDVKLLLTLRGRLVRASDRAPIAGGVAELCTVVHAPAAPRSLADAISDDAGLFLIHVESVEAGQLAVIGSAGGYLGKSVPATLDSGQTTDLGDIALSEGVCLEGRVITADGSAPIATEIVANTHAEGDTWIFLHLGVWAVRDDALVPKSVRAPLAADGSFRLCGLAADEYWIYASYPGCSLKAESLDVRAPDSNVRLHLSSAVYRIRAFDAQSGEPIEKAQFFFDNRPGFGCWLQQGLVVVTDPGIAVDGQVVAPGHRASKYKLPALAPCEVREIKALLARLPEQVECTLVVTSPDGAPVEGIDVDIHFDASEIDGQGPVPNFARHASRGPFTLPKLLPGTYHVEVNPRWFEYPAAEMWVGAKFDLNVRAGMEPVKVQFVGGGLVQATVRRSDGESVDARTTLVRDERSPPEQLDWHRDLEGFQGWIPKGTAARLTKPLPAGHWTLRFDADGCKKKDVDVDIVSGKTSTIEVRLELEPVQPH